MTFSAEQLDQLEGALRELKTRLENLLSDTQADAAPVKLKDNQGRLSRMDEMHNQSILIANRNLTKNRLKNISAAADRLAEGSYGECTECAEMISFVRLQAYPEAAMCIVCQEQAEQ